MRNVLLRILLFILVGIVVAWMVHVVLAPSPMQQKARDVARFDSIGNRIIQYLNKNTNHVPISVAELVSTQVLSESERTFIEQRKIEYFSNATNNTDIVLLWRLTKYCECLCRRDGVNYMRDPTDPMNLSHTNAPSSPL